MGSGASCTERQSTSLDERLRTMLILRSYNCRPRDWTMQEQFDAFADGGIITKDRLREALRLSECPRIEALLEGCLLRPYFTASTSGNTPPSRATAISVSALISFIEGSSTRGALLPSPVEGQSAMPPMAAPGDVGVGIMSMKATKVPLSITSMSQRAAEAIPMTEGTSTVRNMSCGGLSPRVVPLIPKWATSAEVGKRSFDASVCSQGTGVDGSVQEGLPGAGEGGSDEVPGGCAGGPCTTLVRHLGTVLGLRGKEAYRRPGPAQPVWRKRETLIQERIVQYTTLDEEGTVQELFETEKSQTEVLHMECKRTGEFAHRESTHYESGEAFNGEVVLEETGAEHYVHLRSVDDEYENLESTLPMRARQGGAGAGAAGGGDAGTGGPHADTTSYEAESPDVDGGTKGAGENGGSDREEEGFNHQNSGNGEIHRDGQTPSSTQMQSDGTAESTADGTEGWPWAAARGANGRQHVGVPPSEYHYRSPSCSPRLSPRPVRSPYRQEGVGGRENPGRFESGCWRSSTRPGAEPSFTEPSGLERGSAAGGREKEDEDEEEEEEKGEVNERLAGANRVDITSPGLALDPENAGARLNVTADCGFGTKRVHTAQNRLNNASGMNSTDNMADDGLPWENMTTFAEFDAEPGGNGEKDGSVDSVAGGGHSVVFFDNSSVKENDGTSIGDGEGWHQMEGIGSGLRGLEFAFGADDGSVVLPGPEKVEVPLNSPTRITEGTLDTTLSSAEVAADPKSEYTSRVLDGILSDCRVDATADRVWEDIDDIAKYKETNEDQRKYEASTVVLLGVEKRYPSGGAAPFYSHNWDGVAEQSI